MINQTQFEGEDRVPQHVLVEAGVHLMEAAGHKMVRTGKGRAMVYALEDGNTVRIRTCNDPILVAVAEGTASDAKTNLEGTNWILFVMPTNRRRRGPVEAYLIPTSEATEAVRIGHEAWIASGANTKGDSTARSLWFEDLPNSSLPTEAKGFAKKWEKYKLRGSGLPLSLVSVESQPDKVPALPNLSTVIAEAKEKIARAAGTSPDSVKITVSI